MNFNISTITNVKDNHPKDLTLPYDELVKLLTHFPDKIIPKGKGQGFIAGHFSGKQRLTENLISRSLITLDLDNYNSDLTSLECLLKRELSDQWYIAYSTSSHSLETPKIRIVILLDKEIPTESYRTVVSNFVNDLELKQYLDFDSSTKPNQFMYLPARSYDGYTPWFMVNENEGVLLNPDYYIVDYGLNDAISIDTLTNTLVNTNVAKSRVFNNPNIDPILVSIKNQPLDISIEKINQTLATYKAQVTDYHKWLEVGAALHHQFEGSVEGANIWLDWSKLDTRYTHEHIVREITAKWPSFKQNANPITFATIIKNAQLSRVETFNKKITQDYMIALPLIPREKFIHTKGKAITPLNTIENFKVILSEYKISINYDVILKRHTVNFNGHEERDLNKAEARLESLCIQNDMSAKSVGKYTILTSKDTNSWKEFIESKPWDGIDRFSDLCATVNVDPVHEDIKVKYLRAWLMQMIHLTCLNDEENAKMGRLVLVFQSKQGGGKTSWFKTLCPKTHQRYLQEAVALNTRDAMSVLLCVSHVFVELGEMGSTFKKSDQDDLKNFISNTTDMINMKYDKYHAEARRRTVFFGSVNEYNFLQDQTGSTRYLCLPILSCDYMHDIDMQQLYAQLLANANNGEDYHLDEEGKKEQKDLNSDFQIQSFLEEKFYKVFNTELTSRDNKMTNSEVLEKFGYPPQACKNGPLTEIARVLRDPGYEQRVKCYPRYWFLPPFRNDF